MCSSLYFDQSKFLTFYSPYLPKPRKSLVWPYISNYAKYSKIFILLHVYAAFFLKSDIQVNSAKSAYSAIFLVISPIPLIPANPPNPPSFTEFGFSTTSNLFCSIRQIIKNPPIPLTLPNPPIASNSSKSAESDFQPKDYFTCFFDQFAYGLDGFVFFLSQPYCFSNF